MKHTRSLVLGGARLRESTGSEYRQGTLTQHEVAEANGISVRTLQHWLRHLQTIPPRDLRPAETVRAQLRATSLRLSLPDAPMESGPQ